MRCSRTSTGSPLFDTLRPCRWKTTYLSTFADVRGYLYLRLGPSFADSRGSTDRSWLTSLTLECSKTASARSTIWVCAKALIDTDSHTGLA